MVYLVNIETTLLLLRVL